MPRNTMILAFTKFLLLGLYASRCLAGANDEELNALAKQLADRNPEIQIAACDALKSRGEEAGELSGLLVELMLRSGKNPKVFTAAADALEKTAPQVQPHVLTIMLNSDSKGQMRLGAAEQIGQLGEKGIAGLPVMKALWSEPSNNYKQERLLKALFAVGQKDEQVNKLILMIALGKLDKVMLGANECKCMAIEMIVDSRLSDEEINTALCASALGRYMGYQANRQLVERVQSGKASKEKVTETFLMVYLDSVKRNISDAGSVKALKALGADAARALPILQQLRMHPSPEVRDTVKGIIESIERGMKVEMPEIGDVWEVTMVEKDGRALLVCGEKKVDFSANHDHVTVFDAGGKTLRDPASLGAAIKVGVKMRIQFEKEKILSAKVVK